MTSQIYETFAEDQRHAVESSTKEIFRYLIQKGQYIGDVYSMSYETALVLIHDFYRKRVGGIPSLSFLIATRINVDDPNVDDPIDYTSEDASILLLRVMDAAPLPNASEAERVRVETAQRVSGEVEKHWDDTGSMDPTTHNLLSFAGVKCRIIGTFFLDNAPEDYESAPVILRFGSDISNYYPNRGLKVYKPNAKALEAIVNYRDPDKLRESSHPGVDIGTIRYASTNRAFQGVSNVPVSLSPDDLLSQKTALFGMTRTGKSNTTKIILQSVFNLRFDDHIPIRIGQIVFDPNGEYANENVQDENQQQNPSAIKNVWKSNEKGVEADVVTYGITPHPNDPHRRLMLLNFYADENLNIGKEIIDAALAFEGSKYIQNFRQVAFDQPPESDHSATTRYRRRVLVYRALLAKAGFGIPSQLRPQIQGLFNSELISHLRQSSGTNATEYLSAADRKSNPNATWAQIAQALEYLHDFIEDRSSNYQAFEQWYISRPNASGDPWADDDLKKLLVMFSYPNGSRLIARVREQHAASTTSDYAADVYNHLVKGQLVIIDQSSGDPEINKSSAERIMWYIFRQNQTEFRHGKIPPEILIYVEEAHNLLPAGTEMDLHDVWVRTAKEGAKYRLGMVYATQEVSSIQRNILKNTANWFIGHLNNTDETKELCKYYDFADFEASIRRAQDRGFVRVKTLSNLFVIPVQIRKFEV